LLTLHPNNRAGIRYLTVHPAWQKRGIGTTLLKIAEQRAREVHAKKQIGLTTAYHPCCPQQDLVDWYLKRGYQHVACYFGFPSEFKEAWKSEFREKAYFKYFEKDLI